MNADPETDQIGSGRHVGHVQRACRLEELLRRRRASQQRLDFPPQRLVSLAHLLQEVAAVLGRTRQRRFVENRDPFALLRHAPMIIE